MDLEMSFAGAEDVMQRIELFVKSLWARFLEHPGTVIKAPLSAAEFPRMKYEEAMWKYGSDKPDLRVQGEVCYDPFNRK